MVKLKLQDLYIHQLAGNHWQADTTQIALAFQNLRTLHTGSAVAAATGCAEDVRTEEHFCHRLDYHSKSGGRRS